MSLFNRVFVLTLIGGLLLTVPAPRTTAQTSTVQTSTSEPPAVAALVKEAEAAEAAKQFGVAGGKYEAALKLKPGDADLTIRAGEAYVRHGNAARGRQLIDSLRARADVDQRAVTMTLASLDLRLKRPERSLGLLSDYLSAADTPDEETLNALGTVLTLLDEDQRRQKSYAKATAAYFVHQTLLEQSRPNERRWGSQWLTKKEADRQYRALARAQQAVHVARKNLRDARERAEDAEKRFKALRGSGARAAIGQARVRMESAQQDVEAHEVKLRQAISAVPRPPFPDQIAAMDVKRVEPTKPTETTAVAAATAPEPADPVIETEAAPELTTAAAPPPPVPTPTVAPTPAPPPTATSQRPSGKSRPLPAGVKHRLPNGLELEFQEVALRRVELAGGGGDEGPASSRALFDSPDEARYTAATPMTVIKMRVTNPGSVRANYLGLNGLGEVPCAWLSGGGGKWIPAEFADGVAREAVTQIELKPGESVIDLLVFPPDAYDAAKLTLHISGLSFGGTAKVDVPVL